tara:strand:+ start:1944 stop:2255 length:312 start_codon:yes stop_codon:yes gene_type:complete
MDWEGIIKNELYSSKVLNSEEKFDGVFNEKRDIILLERLFNRDGIEKFTLSEMFKLVAILLRIERLKAADLKDYSFNFSQQIQNTMTALFKASDALRQAEVFR